LTALTIKVASAQKEWQTLANIAGSSVDEFKATAFAAEQVGISAEKLADISKDTKEKLGEFVATGGGGFKDFFEQVAPQVGITAEELQKLSGPEVLQKVTNALNQANVPLAQQSFFLESIASDTTNLIPLLANEGAELNRLTSRYNELNDALSITSSEQSALKGLSEDFDLLTKTGSNAIVFLTAQFAPELKGFLTFVTNEVPKATQEIFAFFDAFRDTENRQSIQGIDDEIADLLATASALQQKINSGFFKDFTLFGQTVSLNGRPLAVAEQDLKNIRLEIEALRAQKAKIISDETSNNKSTIGELPAASTGFDFIGAKQEQDRLDAIKKAKEEEAKIDADFLKKEEQRRQQRVQGIQSSLATISSLTSSSNKELFRIGQAGALAQATINIAQGVTEALKLGPIVGPILASGVVAAGGVQIATIAGQSPPSAGSFANGGIIGGGSFAGDNITANVNSGEMILNRGQQKNLFDIANGSGGRGANVTVINNAPGAIAREETLSSGEVRIIVEQELSSQVLRPNSQFNKNLDKTRKVSRQL